MRPGGNQHMTSARTWRSLLAGGFAASILAFAGFAGILRGNPAAEALSNCTVSNLSTDAEEAAFLTLINTYRSQNGLGSLALSTNLSRAATWHGGDMGAKGYFSHTDSLGRNPSARARDCDYPGGAGENIAAGTVWDTAQEAFTAWRNSSGHNANMLNSNYTMIGIARVYVSGSRYGWYWVTNFGTVNDGTSGGGGGQATATPTRTATQPPAATATPTRTPTQPPASTAPATFSSPAPGSTLPGATATFSWSPASGALEYFVYLGRTPGSNNIVGRSVGTATSTTVTNIPTDGSTIYARLWTRFANGWQYTDVTYRAASSGGGGGSTVNQKATLASPANGSTLGTSQAFSWSTGSGALEYFFYAGTVPGSNNLVGTSTGTNRGITLNNLPRGGITIYVRLWTRFANGWQYSDYSFRGPQ